MAKAKDEATKTDATASAEGTEETKAGRPKIDQDQRVKVIVKIATLPDKTFENTRKKATQAARRYIRAHALSITTEGSSTTEADGVITMTIAGTPAVKEAKTKAKTAKKADKTDKSNKKADGPTENKGDLPPADAEAIRDW